MVGSNGTGLDWYDYLSSMDSQEKTVSFTNFSVNFTRKFCSILQFTEINNISSFKNNKIESVLMNFFFSHFLRYQKLKCKVLRFMILGLFYWGHPQKTSQEVCMERPPSPYLDVLCGWPVSCFFFLNFFEERHFKHSFFTSTLISKVWAHVISIWLLKLLND